MYLLWVFNIDVNKRHINKSYIYNNHKEKRIMSDRRKMNKQHYLLLLKQFDLNSKNAHSKLELEKTLFFSLASRDDVKKILNIAPMSFDDFDRIFYILQSLNLNELSFVMFREHYKDFEEELDFIQECSKRDIHEETLLHVKWLEDFCGQIANPDYAEIVRKFFELSL